MYTNWTLTGFELRTSVVRSNLSAKWATTSAPLIMFLIEKLYPSLDSNPGRLQCNCPLKKRPRLLCFCELFNDGALLSGKRQVGTTFSLQSLFRQLMRGLGRGSRHCKYLFIVLGGRQTGWKEEKMILAPKKWRPSFKMNWNGHWGLFALSVTRWINHLFNIWSFTTIKICLIALKIA